MYERTAIEAWKQIVDAAGDIYSDDLMMGVRKVTRGDDKYEWVKELSGHWRDEYVLLEKGFADLEKKRDDFVPDKSVKTAPKYKVAKSIDKDSLFQFTHQAVTRAPVNHPIRVKVNVRALNGVKWVRLRYRSVNQHNDYMILQMQPGNEKDVYQAVVPADQINPEYDFMYFVEVMDNHGNGTIYPDLNKETPYIVVTLVR